MNRVIYEILENTVEPELFRESLLKLNGDFDFSLDSMIKLGEIYCLLYPASVSHGDSAQVQKGYRIVRIAIVEVLLRNMDNDLKRSYREMFADITTINNNLGMVVSKLGREETLRIHNELDSKVKDIKSDIDRMGNSVIKERFTGGITVFYNILYLMKKSLNI